MKILPLGVDFETGEALLDAQSEIDFAGVLLQTLSQESKFGSIFKETTRGEVQRPSTIDLGDSRKAGWSYVVDSFDPNLDEIIRILEPLARHRGMVSPEKPLFFSGQAPQEWFDWIMKHLSPFGFEDPPYYLLIVGGPERIPFRFQSFLSSSFAVGRLAFDHLDDLAAYVEKILALEENARPVVNRSSVFLAPDGGHGDATFFSQRYMAKPLAHLVEKTLNVPVIRLFGESATHPNFQDALTASRSALVYSASHGLDAPNRPWDFQKQFNGAIVCQPAKAGQPLPDRLFSANDVLLEKPFLYGGIFFQFACFGYGTPAISDFSHWRDDAVPARNTSTDFVAALPKRILAHSYGPIAYIGHVDMAWLYGFAEPDEMDLDEWWNPRLKPFAQALEGLLITQPVGLALQEMNKRYNNLNAYLTNLFDSVQQAGVNNNERLMKKIAYSYVVRNDAQNFMILGDPAVRLRLPG